MDDSRHTPKRNDFFRCDAPFDAACMLVMSAQSLLLPLALEDPRDHEHAAIAADAKAPCIRGPRYRTTVGLKPRKPGADIDESSVHSGP